MEEQATYFINGVGIISPQKTFGPEAFLAEISQYDKNVLTCVLPDFKAYVNPIQLRRLSRMLRIGLSAATICLRNSKISMPDGIITATGYGFLDETAKFLRELLEQREKQLTPTYFMQGTSNALAGLVALTIKCMGYNNTYASKGIAFENALADAMMQLNENPSLNFLIGSYDEAAEVQYNASTRASHFKTEFINNLSLFDTGTKGSIQGEGSAFFMLSGRSSALTLCVMSDMGVVYKPDGSELQDALDNFITTNRLNPKDIDLIINGVSGDVQHDAVTNALILSRFENNAQTRFKHLCGEYTTATSFALWLGASILSRQLVPEIVKVERWNKPEKLKTILIVNQYMNKSFTFILLKEFTQSR
jgi:3-oxoacyl-[acyl-carrier-protein] synthase II